MTPHLVSDAERTAPIIDEFLAAERELARIRNRLGRSLYDRRTALDLSCMAVSRLAQVPHSELSRLERGGLRRGIDMARRVDETLSAIESERAQMRQARAS